MRFNRNPCLASGPQLGGCSGAGGGEGAVAARPTQPARGRGLWARGTWGEASTAVLPTPLD